ncbi:MAG: hypothetical protein PHI05_00470 [Bacilli bacterium]|nr:hypothetical protein [Bacilli bacterium]
MKNELKNKLNPITFIKAVKENKRTRAMFLLGLYFIFFAVVIQITKPSSYVPNPVNENKEPVDILEKYKDWSKYDFENKIIYMEKEEELNYNLIGELKNDIVYFTDLNNNEYYLKENILYLVRSEIDEVIENQMMTDVLKFSPSYIYDLIKQSVLDSQTEIYSNETLKKVYRLDLQKINDISSGFMLITSIEDKQNIKEIVINFENENNEPLIIDNIKEIKITYTIS